MAARFICQVEGCGKLYLEKKPYEIHLRHHKSYVPSKGRYFKCDHCESKFNTQGNLDVHVIHSHLSNSQASEHTSIKAILLNGSREMDVLNHLKTAHAQYVIRIIMAKLVNKSYLCKKTKLIFIKIMIPIAFIIKN